MATVREAHELGEALFSDQLGEVHRQKGRRK